MQINIAQLTEGLHRLSFVEAAHRIDLPGQSKIQGPVALDLKIDKRTRDLNISGTISADAVLTCDRCLADFVREIRAEFKVYYSADFSDESSSDIKFWNPNEPEINLFPEIRDAIVLSVPIKMLCRENCLGLCIECGTNLNVSTCSCTRENLDSRWDNLRYLQNGITDNPIGSYK